jgi:hypothetical protein
MAQQAVDQALSRISATSASTLALPSPLGLGLLVLAALRQRHSQRLLAQPSPLDQPQHLLAAMLGRPPSGRSSRLVAVAVGRQASLVELLRPMLHSPLTEYSQQRLLVELAQVQALLVREQTLFRIHCSHSLQRRMQATLEALEQSR